MKRISLPIIAEILAEELQSYGILVYRLAKDIGVPASRMQDIRAKF